MDPLATVADLQALGVDTTTNPALVDSLLDSVSSAVRDAAGSLITRTTSTATIWTEASRRLELPVRPVRSVSSVKIDDQDFTSYRLLGSSLWRDCYWHQPGETPSAVTVTFDHGYDEVPADIVNLVCMLVAAGVNEAANGGLASHRGLSSERIDDAQISYATGESEVVDVTELPERTKLALRQRFGTPRTGVYETVR
ncbi:hypothetical protein GCM10025864_39540 [Luteimicrobium album]|uniref:Uncharacterized protein n=1 Tax=Luteimicrobium album TaxID=1054550 RepID=A0ABQ6I6P9_9MICO|nr:hypothetical protein [Luteimicrobium album]GMA26195.1 hypothetical protein GCM10025864_39540 [Luteimicrobium album]